MSGEVRKERLRDRVDRMIAEGATDAEVMDSFPRLQPGVPAHREPFAVYLTIPERRWVEGYLHAERRAWRELVVAYRLADEKNQP